MPTEIFACTLEEQGQESHSRLHLAQAVPLHVRDSMKIPGISEGTLPALICPS